MPAPLRDALTAPPGAGARADPGVEAKVAFLRDPSSYAVHTRAVEAIETHWSWVFLTDHYAYKLKKPARLDHHDLGSVEARRRNCAAEIRLNRRLCPDVYLGAIALCATPAGLRFGADGADAVDWLVLMRRLPRELMLDRAIAARRVTQREIRMVAMLLARFHRTCAPEPITPAAFRARLAERMHDNAAALLDPRAGLGAALVEAEHARQLRFLSEHGALLDERVERGLIVEGHGDLRPEHICLEVPPLIIDCVEFSRDLRVADGAEEIAFLALECERLGEPPLREALLAAYRDACADDLPDELAHFYQAHHALSRAKLAVWRLSDCAPEERPRWRERARTYVQLAARHGSLHSPR